VIRTLTAGVIVADPQFREAIRTSLRSFGVNLAFVVSDAAGETDKLANTDPDVLVLDFGRTSAHVVMAELKTIARAPAVIGAHTSGDPEIILAALRAGAREFVYPPLNETALKNALEIIASERTLRGARRRSGKAIGFLSASGGCGATTVAAHVAAELRRITESDVTLADFDLAAGMAALWLRAGGSYSVLDVVNNLARLDLSLWKGIVSTVQPHLDVLAAPADIPLGELPPPQRFADVLRFARSACDWLVADLGQGFGPLSATLASGLDALYLVTSTEVTALYQARRILRAVVESGFQKERLKLVIGRLQKDSGFGPQDLEKMLAFPVEFVFPEDRREVAEAHADGRLVLAGCELGRRLTQLASAIAGKPVDEARPSKFSLFRFRAQEA
jgi:pilus assembly protein CpaE